METQYEEEQWPTEMGSAANPFIGSFKINVIRTHVYDREGQQLPHYDFETDIKTSVYHDDDTSYNLCVNAKPVTIKLYMFIIYRLLKPNMDYITLDPTKVCEALDISRRSLYVAIAELQDYRVMTKRRGKHYYWINPQFLFNGRRTKYMELYSPQDIHIVKHKTQQQ